VEKASDIPANRGNRQGIRGDYRQRKTCPDGRGRCSRSAWQSEAQILSRMQAAEPAMGGVEAEGTDFNPQSGKTATTAFLQAKSSDALTQAEIENLNTAIKEMGRKETGNSPPTGRQAYHCA
jgi:hypothetical protein